MKRLAVIALVFMFALAGCEGGRGPEGEMGLSVIGPEGEPGPEGPVGDPGPPGAGTREVYSGGDFVLPEHENPFCVSVPTIHLDDMPVVLVYVSKSKESWVLTPVTEWTFDNYLMWAEIGEGEVCLYDCIGHYYKIVVVM